LVEVGEDIKKQRNCCIYTILAHFGCILTERNLGY
jgi:hypothetical protein